MIPLIALLLAQWLGPDAPPFVAPTISQLPPYQCTGTGCVSRSMASKEGDIISAADYSGVDGCAQIQAALNALPAGGGIIDASMLTGTQACTSNPVLQAGDATCLPSCPKPFKLKLGPSIWQVTVPWVFGEGGEAYHTGQMIEGCGIECTTLQPTSGFSGSVVLQIKPPGADVIVRQASFHDLTIDMNNVSGKTGVDLLSVSNLPTISNVTVIRNNGRCLHIGPLSASATIPEGVTLDTFNCYFKTPKTANGAELGNLNEFTWKNSKIMGSFDGTCCDLNFVGVLIQSELNPGAPINTAGEAGQFPNTSIDSFDTGIKITSAGNWASAKNNLFTNMTLENLNIGFNLAGFNAGNTTSGNILIGNRYLSTVPVHVKMDFADSNMVMESKINAAVGSYVLTANSLNNMLFRQFSQSNKSDVSDSGTGNVFLGWIGTNGIQLGKGGAGASNTQVQIDSGATGAAQLQWVRNQVVKATAQVSDSLGTDEFDLSVGSNTYRFTPGGVFVAPSTINNASLTFASLPGSSNGATIYCSDCVTAPTCAASGSGAFATRVNGTWRCNGGGVGSEHDFSAFSSANLAAVTSISQTKATNASTLTADSTISTHVVGVGAGNLVVRLCSDGTTCGAGNIYLTCTQACTAAAGTVTACAVTKAAVAAATVLTWEVGTACATTNPIVNLNAHLTTP